VEESDVLVVVVTYNSAAEIEPLLDGLPDALGKLAYQVVVVDNGSTDATAAIVGARDDCELVRSTNVGYAGGINRGVAAGRRSHAILVLNPDVEMEPGSVEAMMAALDRPGVGIVAPQIRDSDGSLQYTLGREPTLLRALGLGRLGHRLVSERCVSDGEYVKGHPVDWALGAVLLVSRQCHDAVGGWDESYFLHSEETDLSLRTRDRGWLTYYEPAARALHHGKRSGYDDRIHSMQIVNRVRLYSRRHGAAASWTYYGLTVLSELSWLARGNDQSRASVQALLRPGRRPAEIGCASRLLPT